MKKGWGGKRSGSWYLVSIKWALCVGSDLCWLAPWRSARAWIRADLSSGRRAAPQTDKSKAVVINEAYRYNVSKDMPSHLLLYHLNLHRRASEIPDYVQLLETALRAFIVIFPAGFVEGTNLLHVTQRRILFRLVVIILCIDDRCYQLLHQHDPEKNSSHLQQPFQPGHHSSSQLPLR